MNNYYTYAYLREDGTPYYIGKGKGSRITRLNHNVPIPPQDRILYLKRNLTEEEAYMHEIYMIAVLGRKNTGTGILRNLTDGGEGRRGYVMSEEQKKQISNFHKGRKLTEEQRLRNIENLKANWRNPKCREKMLENARKNKPPIFYGADHHNSKTWRITFSDGKIIEKCGISIWAKNNNYDCNKIYMIAKGKRKTHKDIVAVEKLDPTP